IALGSASCSYYLDTSHHVTSSAPSPNTSVSLSTFELDRYPSLMCSSSSFRALQSASLDIPHRVASPTPSNADASVSLSTFDLERFPSLICPSSSFRALASASRRSSAASSFSFSTSMDDADGVDDIAIK
ncbi:hypothetical protein AZE42_13639, partial [Rhizopogon vesiculosus]